MDMPEKQVASHRNGRTQIRVTIRVGVRVLVRVRIKPVMVEAHQRRAIPLLGTAEGVHDAGTLSCREEVIDSEQPGYSHDSYD